MDGVSAGERALGRLLERAHRMAPEDLADRVRDAAAELGAADAAVHLVDYDQVALRPLPGSAPTNRELLLDDTVAGRAFTTLDEQVERPSDGDPATVWLPLLDGVERLGVLELRLADELVADDLVRRRAAALAALVAELLLTKGMVGDTLQTASRRRPMSLAAEMQWQVLPPLTAGTERVTVAGILEPCYEVGGDAFDYALAADRVQFAIFDGMGHGLEAATLSTVAIAAYRHGRRSGLDLAEIATSVDAALARLFPTTRFVTGVLAELDLGTGHVRWLNAGHPAPLLLRDGRVVDHLSVRPRTPLGIPPVAGPVELGEADLEPGDRLLLYTDGIVEARSPDGEFFGLERLERFVARETAGVVVLQEAMRRLKNAVLAHQQGRLQDDASQLLVEWHPDGGAR